jgi:hypothetical protein
MLSFENIRMPYYLLNYLSQILMHWFAPQTINWYIFVTYNIYFLTKISGQRYS